MEKTNKNICRLCLTVKDGSFSSLNVLSEEKLNVVVPELKLAISTQFVSCSKCKSSVEEFYKWKTKFQCTVPEKDQKVCFICSNNFGQGGKKFQKDTDYLFCSILQMCLPQLGQYYMDKIVICAKCYDTLRNMYFFNHKCISVHKKIELYCKFNPSKDIDLNEILKFRMENSSNILSSSNFHVENKDRGESDFRGEQKESDNRLSATGSHERDNENKKKCPTPEEAYSKLDTSGEPPNKKKKIDRRDSNRLLYDGLPMFHLHFNNMMQPKKGNNVTMAEWLERVEKIREQNGWTIEFTRKKVLARLKTLQKMHLWLIDLTEGMSWEDLKYTLISSFPGLNDFCVNIKRVLHMYKDPKFGYVQYFNRKMKLLRYLDISDEEAVSLITAGIKDFSIKKEARAKYNSPAELLEYFNQCDETNSHKNLPNESDTARYIDKEKLCPRNGISNVETLSSLGSDTRTLGDFISQQECQCCGRVGHFEIDCPLNSFMDSRDKNSDVICSFCGFVGHISLNCPDMDCEKPKKRGRKI